VRRRVTPVLLLVALVAGCGPRPWWTATQLPKRQTHSLPFDTRDVFSMMGLAVDSTRFGFVASLRFLATPLPDSTLAVFAMSFPSRSLSFRTEGSDFVAAYHVDVTVRAAGDSTGIRQFTRDENVRVHTIRETQRADESIIFQQFFSLRPGAYTVNVAVRDLNSSSHGQREIADTVPRFQGPGLGQPVPLYQSGKRTKLTDVPHVIVNPRGMVVHATDTLRFYVEGYGLKPGTKVAARVVDMDTIELWHDTLSLAGDSALSSGEFLIKPGGLPLGRGDLRVNAVGEPKVAEMRVPFLVGFSERWAVTQFDQMVSLLRYFERQDLLDKLKAAPRTARAAAWRDFYTASDTAPGTPDNEALDEYFQRVEAANRRFAEPSNPGWLTDRGEVFISLGEPDQTSELAGRISPGLRWEYTRHHLTLYFDDVSGLGQYHLSPESRTDFQNALNRVRRTS
jgi:GWxTD domain-containing protein